MSQSEMWISLSLSLTEESPHGLMGDRFEERQKRFQSSTLPITDTAESPPSKTPVSVTSPFSPGPTGGPYSCLCAICQLVYFNQPESINAGIILWISPFNGVNDCPCVKHNDYPCVKPFSNFWPEYCPEPPTGLSVKLYWPAIAGQIYG